MRKAIVKAISFECQVIGFASTALRDWLKKKLAPLFHPIRSKTKTNRDSLARVFPRFTSATCNYFEFWLVYCIVCVFCGWLEEWLLWCSVLPHSLQLNNLLTTDYARVLNLEFSNANVESKKKNRTRIFNNLLFYLEVVAYFEKKFKAEF